MKPRVAFACLGAFVAALLASGPPAAAASSPPSIRVVQWNVYRSGCGTDGVLDRGRQVTWMIGQAPDVITLNEASAAAAADYHGRVQAATGKVWALHHVPADGGGSGNAILTRFPMLSTHGYVMSIGSRSVAQAALDVGGVRVNVFVTHLDSGDRPENRDVQVAELRQYLGGFAAPRVVAGDMNAAPDYPEIQPLLAEYVDAWEHALDRGAAFAYPPDNPADRFTRTQWKRIDYILTSDEGALLASGCEIPDQRDLSNTNVVARCGTPDDKGVRPSDHNMLSCTLAWQPLPVPGDTTPPLVALLSPPPDLPAARITRVEAGATDNVGVAEVAFLIDGVPVAVDRWAPYEYAWRTDTVQAGTHTIEVAARDAAGNAAIASQPIVVLAAANTTSEVVVWAADALVAPGWSRVSDPGAAGGARLANPNLGVAKPATALPSPSRYFELTVPVESGTPYRLWLRGMAEGTSTSNDSVFVQFSGSVTASGAATYRIGTTAALDVVLEDFSLAGINAWGWANAGWGVADLGPEIYFAQTGLQTLRVQPREDGLAIDQVVLSASTYLNAYPGGTKNDHTILNRTVTQPASMPGGDPPDAGEVVVWPAATAERHGRWTLTPDASAAGGARLQNPNAGAAKLSVALAAPQDYFELTFTADAGTPYRLWMRGAATSNNWANDSVFVQFDRSVTAAGAPVYRIGTTSATVYTLEECSGCGLAGWGWADNGYGIGALGPLIYFDTTGPQRLRVQVREDGLGVDQIVLSPATYLTAAPGPAKHDATILPQTQTPTPNVPPAVTITAPVAGAVFAAPATIAITAAASDADGVVTQVAFFANGACVGTRTALPWAVDWTGVNAGSYTLTARATDDRGQTITSAAVSISVSAGPPGTPGDVVLYALEASIGGRWSVTPDASAAGGARLQNPNAGAAKLSVALAAPQDYFELTFTADAGRPYRLWMRGKATSNAWANDSVFVQFDRSVTAAGAPVYRIGTTSATVYTLEECSGCGLAGWGWADNGYGIGALGPLIYFDTAGPQRLRIQMREDGLGLDQVVLSPETYLATAPGPAKNDTTILPKG